MHAYIPNDRLKQGGWISIFIPSKNAKEAAMNTRAKPLPRDLRLAHKALYSLPDAAGLAVACDEGVLWLTVDGDPRDFVLEAGQTFETQNHARVLVYALADSRISVRDTPPAPQPVPWYGLQLPTRLSPAGQA
jgi:hypothetical protein